MQKLRTIISDRWAYLKWVVKELIATCSDQPSYFSKKRIQSWLLFDAGLGAMMWWLFEHIHTMTYMEIIAFSSVLFGAAGYQIRTIQKEKEFNKNLEKAQPPGEA